MDQQACAPPHSPCMTEWTQCMAPMLLSTCRVPPEPPQAPPYRKVLASVQLLPQAQLASTNSSSNSGSGGLAAALELHWGSMQCDTASRLMRHPQV